MGDLIALALYAIFSGDTVYLVCRRAVRNLFALFYDGDRLHRLSYWISAQSQRMRYTYARKSIDLSHVYVTVLYACTCICIYEPSFGFISIRIGHILLE